MFLLKTGGRLIIRVILYSDQYGSIFEGTTFAWVNEIDAGKCICMFTAQPKQSYMRICVFLGNITVFQSQKEKQVHSSVVCVCACQDVKALWRRTPQVG